MTAPARYENGFPVTPDDGNDLKRIASALVIGTAGTLQVTTAAGDKIALTVPAGVLPLRVKRVWATNTAAANITALTEN